MKRKVNITKRTLQFGIDIAKLVHKIPKTPAGFSLGGQLVRSGTAIGAEIQEAQNSPSKKDFIYKINHALKEAKEARYWLIILVNSGILSKQECECVFDECSELIPILITILKRTKENIKVKK